MAYDDLGKSLKGPRKPFFFCETEKGKNSIGIELHRKYTDSL